jgi:uncharacterized protein (TIGR00288 family)
MNSRNARPVNRAQTALVHRGPQAVNLQQAVPGFHAPNAALLIDFDNVTMGIRSDLGKELRSLLSSEIIKGKVAVQRAYADWRRYPQYIVPLSESSIDLIFAPAYGSSKKNATDIRLAIDALELVFTRPEIGTFILLSGDSDFSSLVIKLKEYGKYVIGVGIRESSSDLLVQNCDEYYSYNALAGLVKANDENEPQKKWDPWELVTEAVGRMKKNGDVMRSDRLKQVMQELDASFDEKDLGMSKFSRFVQEAQNKGLVSVNKLENGQLEIDLPAGAAVPTVAPQAGAAAPAAESRDRDEEAGRPRRGRRGRGRGGRDREDRPPREPRVEAAPAAEPTPSVERSASPAPREDAAGGTGERLTRHPSGSLRPRAAYRGRDGVGRCARACERRSIEGARASWSRQRKPERSDVRPRPQGCARQRYHRPPSSRRRLRGRACGRSRIGGRSAGESRRRTRAGSVGAFGACATSRHGPARRWSHARQAWRAAAGPAQHRRCEHAGRSGR